MTNWKHHWAIFQRALREDRARTKGLIPTQEADFLPAALEVIERPVSPTARVMTWVLLSGLLTMIGWTVVGRVDVVASAAGKIIPTGNVKLVQSAGSGVVRAIYVHDGDVVRKGQSLVDLDPTLSSAALAQAQKDLAAAELDIARNQALANALAGGRLSFNLPASTPPEVADTQRRLIASQIAEIEATTAGLVAARASALADARSAEAQMAKLGETVPILDREIENMNVLDSKGYAPGLRLLELKRQRRQETGDREIAAAQRARGLSEARKLSEQLNQMGAQARRNALTDLAKAQAEAILRREDVTKASQRHSFQHLVAPADGTIQQLAVHTVGGVVEPARALMIIVPSQGGLEVEAHILNRDIGFVKTGQPVAVKFEAFPFTRYGAVPGHVKSISRDAVTDPKLGSFYMATITLDRGSINVDGQDVPLTRLIHGEHGNGLAIIA